MKTWNFSPIVLFWLISACSLAKPEAPNMSPAATAYPQFTRAAATNQPASILPTPIQAAETRPPASFQPVEPQESQKAVIYLVAVGDDGVSGRKIGCGDSLVPVEISIPSTRAVLRASLQALLEIKQPYYGESGLYSALYQSDLEIRVIDIQDGTAIIDLAGKMQLGGVCDMPRFEEQLKAVALQFDTVRQVEITINGTPLEELMSLK